MIENAPNSRLRPFGRLARSSRQAEKDHDRPVQAHNVSVIQAADPGAEPVFGHCGGLKPPRPARQQMKALDEAGTVHLLEAAKRSRLYRPIFLAVTTGMRRGEILALRWSAIDLDKGVLSVREALE